MLFYIYCMEFPFGRRYTQINTKQVIKPRIYRILRIRVIRVNSWLEKGNSYAIKLLETLLFTSLES